MPPAVSQKHREAVAVRVRRQNVEDTIAVDVARRDLVRVRTARDGPDRRRLRLHEGAVALVQQDDHLEAVVLGSGDVEVAVAVEVSEGDLADRRPDLDRSAAHGLEPSLSVADEDDDVSALGIGSRAAARAAGDDEVLLTVLVHVADGRSAGHRTDCDRRVGRRDEADSGTGTGLGRAGDGRDEHESADYEAIHERILSA